MLWLATSPEYVSTSICVCWKSGTDRRRYDRQPVVFCDSRQLSKQDVHDVLESVAFCGASSCVIWTGDALKAVLLAVKAVT